MMRGPRRESMNCEVSMTFMVELADLASHNFVRATLEEV
jgi:hypothetical protein